MATIAQALALALEHHRAGDLARAEQIYRQILQVEPANAEAMHLLGVLAYQVGRHDLALHYIGEALARNPLDASFHSNLGLIYQALRRWDEAVASYTAALRLNPSFAEAYHNLGNARKDQGRLREAEACYQEAVRLRPDYVEAHRNLGVVLQEQRRLDEAEAAYRRALGLRPDHAEFHSNLGTALQHQGRLAEAETCYREALRLDPGSAVAHNNLGAVLDDQDCRVEAEACYQEAIRLDPDYAQPHLNRALLWLLQGDWGRGWPEYEWRWKCKGFASRGFSQPLWDGSPLEGRTILVHAEQGLGDTLQFIRYAPLVKQGSGIVVLECQPSLLPLLRGAAGVDQWVARGSALPVFDVQVPLLSLPGILGTIPENVPGQIAYLSADVQRVEQWGSELAGGGFKVGIVWQGSRGYVGDRQRSVPLACFAPLARVEGVRLYSLQKGPGVEQLAGAGFPVIDLGSRLDVAGGAFLDTAAVMQHLDLVIAPNSALVHLAGTLGVRAWLALWSPPEWRWLLGRDDSPWYPSLRLFRQQQPGDWDGVFRRMAEMLATLLDDRAGDAPVGQGTGGG